MTVKCNRLRFGMVARSKALGSSIAVRSKPDPSLLSLPLLLDPSKLESDMFVRSKHVRSDIVIIVVAIIVVAIIVVFVVIIRPKQAWIRHVCHIQTL
jgi:hypothetical protein